MKVIDKKVGFIGAGNMASALISGMINAGFKPENIIASSPGKDHLDLLSKKYKPVTAQLEGGIIGFSMISVILSLLSKFKTLGAKVTNTPKEVMRQCEVVITCLPSPNISAEVMEGKDGLLGEIKPGKIWMEMSNNV